DRHAPVTCAQAAAPHAGSAFFTRVCSSCSAAFLGTWTAGEFPKKEVSHVKTTTRLHICAAAPGRQVAPSARGGGDEQRRPCPGNAHRDGEGPCPHRGRPPRRPGAHPRRALPRRDAGRRAPPAGWGSPAACQGAPTRLLCPGPALAGGGQE